MNYAELCINIQDVCENEFSLDQLAMFTKQAEQKIYNTVQIPALRKSQALTLVVGDPFVALPSDYLYSYSLLVVDMDGAARFLLDKDVNFMREAYPVNSVAARGVPKYYANYDATKLIVGPIPSQAFSMELDYGRYPESIVTAGTTWLGDEFDSALLNGALIEAIRFMKGEKEVVAMYEKLYVQSIGLLKQLGDGKLRQDTYRNGQTRVPVS